MKKIAFIDDEKSVLDGIRRMLRSRRRQWDMHFFTGANEALAAMHEQPFDVVVSDMKMPIINGAEFLKKVQKENPETIRIVLSGYSDAEMILESIHATHQFIAKPADADMISSSLSKAIDTSEWLSDEHLKSLLGSIGTLPPLPKIYDELMHEIASEDCSIKNIARIVSSDLALSTEILRIVNSAFFGLARHIEGVEQATSILGVETIKNLALLTCVFRSFPVSKAEEKQRESLNSQSQLIGGLAQKFAAITDLTPRTRDHAQIAGLMSCLGELIHIAYPDNISDSLDMPLVSSYLLSIWNLPYPLIQAVRWHRSPSLGGVPELSPLTIVHGAWAMYRCFQDTATVGMDNKYLDRAYIDKLIDEQVLKQWLEVAEALLGKSD